MACGHAWVGGPCDKIHQPLWVGGTYPSPLGVIHPPATGGGGGVIHPPATGKLCKLKGPPPRIHLGSSASGYVRFHRFVFDFTVADFVPLLPYWPD